ncbi:AraC family transcriptional regulator [Candidatus Accumulibacter sp. ACC003]|uniref:AraC family transcriptional regulator n=1 Tax=Candidatus Accumulibacter sp. ACC003 TaxID=2823334 RepID=UPI0025BEF85A|nr:AraC family transcriptional regulator [Candidatus Accumulibacter sp. ACC003]
MKNHPGSEAPPSASLSTSGPGEIRVGPTLAIPAVLAELGVSPNDAFAWAGVDPTLFDDPDNRIGIEALGGLLAGCAALSGCDHFGLLVGERFELPELGPLGGLLRHSPTVGEALRGLLRFFHVHDRGAAPLLLAADPSCVILGYSVFHHGLPGLAQIQDAAISIGYRILATLCGPTWKPLRVQFSRSQAGDSAPYHQTFHAPVSFDAKISGLVFASSWLDRTIEGADATIHDRLTEAIRAAEARGPASFAAQVERALPQMVLSGMVSGEAVASTFAVHERTLRRRLEDDGTNLQQLIKQTRFELAKQLLQNTELAVSAIATVLGYDDPNAFSRAFRNWAHASPTQWRAAR